MNRVDLPTKDELKTLAAHEEPVCLTLAMPCVKGGAEKEQNIIRFKNLIQEAEAKLDKIGFKPKEIADFLKPVVELQRQETEFLNRQENGFMCCLSKEIFEFWRLPYEVAENVIVDRRFYLRPILPHAQHEKDVALFLLNPENPVLVFAAADPNLPPSVMRPPHPYTCFRRFKETFEEEKSLQHHAQGPKGDTTRGGTPMYHGQGAGGDAAADKAHLEAYFKKLENWVCDTLRDSGIVEDSVFFVADAQHVGLYKSVMRKSHPELDMLAQKNHDSETVESWVKKARAEREAEMRRADEKALKEYERRKGAQGNGAMDAVPDIVRAANGKRVETLILPQDEQRYYWGRFDAQTQHVEKQERDERHTGAGDELINRAALDTFLNGGAVVAMPEDKLKDRDCIALCRW